MRRAAHVTAVAFALAGCAPAATPVEGRPPVRHVVPAQLPEEPAHDHEQPLEHVDHGQPDDPRDPGAVAVAQVLAGLAEQGLEVVDLGVDAAATDGGRTSVRVAVTHRPDRAGTPHTSVYELHLTRDPDGIWRLDSFGQAQ